MGSKLVAIPSILRHKNLAEYLSTYARALRETYGRAATAEWARSLGISSRITFRHILNGQRRISALSAKILPQAMDYCQSERAQLEKLLAAQAWIDENPGPARASAVFFVDDSFFESAINTIILNLCGSDAPVPQTRIHDICARLYPASAIDASVALLKELQLIRESSTGYERVFHGRLTTLPGRRSTSSRGYFRDVHRLADLAWEQPLHLRELNSFSFQISTEDLPQAKEMIRELRQKLTELSGARPARNSVYQCSISLFPITP